MSQFEITALNSSRIHYRASAHPAVVFAARELRRYLHRITGIDIEIHDRSEAGGRTTLTLGLSPIPAPTPRLAERGSYAIRAADRQITLFGGSPRALLMAVYALLEQLGCVWSLHGADEERIPNLTGATHLAINDVSHTPPFRLRGYTTDIMTWHYTQPEHFHERLPEDRDLIDWMGKSGANTFFYIRHPFDTQLSIPELADDLAKRAIAVEYGGHVIPLLLPRKHFAERPDLFPQDAHGQRFDHGNLCPSNGTALALAAENAAAYVAQHPEMSALHIWGADLWQGGWCRCASCAGLTPQDQSLLTCNAVARGLAEAGQGRPVCYLAYHDTLDARLRMQADARVVCEWAPRERCYGHALHDPDCERNRRYRISLEQHLDLFQGRVRLFEYYGDAILYFGCALPMAEVLAADMSYYQQLGIREALMLQFGTYSTWAYPLSFLAFSEATQRGSVSAARLRAGYCERFAAAAGVAEQAFLVMEQSLGRIARYGDIRVPPKTAPLAAATQSAIAAELPRLRQVLDELTTAKNDHLRSQADLLRYTMLVLEGVAQDIAQQGSGAPLYARALAIAEAADRRSKGFWGAVDLPIIHNFYSAAAEWGASQLAP